MSFLSPFTRKKDRMIYPYFKERQQTLTPRVLCYNLEVTSNLFHLRLNMRSPVMSLSLNPAGTFCCPDFVSL